MFRWIVRILLLTKYVVLSSASYKLVASTDLYQFTPNETVFPSWAHIIQPSLFNNIPPFLKFSLLNEPETRIPEAIRNSLIWCSSVKLVNTVVARTGLKLASNKNCKNWVGFFNGKIAPSRETKRVVKKPYQRYNHYPGSAELCTKDKLWLNLQKTVSKFGEDDFEFLFESYAYPAELYQFYSRNLYKRETQKFWIFKPGRATVSAGIVIFKDFAHMPWNQMRTKGVIQKYLSNPHQILDRRLRYRVYVVITSFHPLRIFVHENGDANLEFPYQASLVAQNQNILKYLGQRGFDVGRIQEKIEDAIIKVMIAGEKKISQQSSVILKNKYNAYQFWTADFTFDNFLHPKLMEMNRYGSLNFSQHEQALVLIPMLTDTLNLVGYHFPPTMSSQGQQLLAKELKRLNPQICGEGVVFNSDLYSFKKTYDKDIQFNEMGIGNRSNYLNAILESLEDHEVRDLMVAEDELGRANNYKRIFPTSQTYRYLKYLESKPHHYMLQDAWENRYSGRRDLAVELLRQYSLKYE